ncbi:uncharacterized protein I206_101594 [Kwoniella pini CBS 10737]|uniref:Uncharacterized protein n=1 Tax=Kwoniella pini CBS 10737 TaxID=1296096 RepID=A0A1B9HW86_9TREE|nr:uncharacterized protein I206_06436 [Kwoniella pini CBS 10737]OCF47535.1 hypothetical protein I206_06436 [Kwoniella pini CBS 10737]
MVIFLPSISANQFSSAIAMHQRRSTPETSTFQPHATTRSCTCKQNLSSSCSPKTNSKIESTTDVASSTYQQTTLVSVNPTSSSDSSRIITSILQPTTRPTSADSESVDTNSQTSTVEDEHDECQETSIIPFASSLSNLAQSINSQSTSTSSSRCTTSGGACGTFIGSLGSCQNDNCVCELSLPAQFCAQCLATQDAIYQYNLYLAACANRGLVQPSQTITAQCDDATVTSDVLTDILASQAASATLSSNGLGSTGEKEGGGYMSQEAVQIGPDGQTMTSTYGQTTSMPSDNGRNPITLTTTDSSGQPTSIITYNGPTSFASISGTVPSADSTGTSQQDGTSESFNTTALDSAHTFFQGSVDSTCQSDCDVWMQLAQSCTDDTCICTSDGLSSAKACSSCVISADSDDQMSAYAGYTQGCTTISTAVITTDEAASTTDMYGNVAAAITSSSSQIGGKNTNPFKTESDDNERVATQVAEAENAGGVATKIATENDPTSGGISLRDGTLISSIGLLITGVSGGVLLMQIG